MTKRERAYIVIQHVFLFPSMLEHVYIFCFWHFQFPNNKKQTNDKDGNNWKAAIRIRTLNVKSKLTRAAC